MILLLANITKLGWFDGVEIKHRIRPDLTMILHSDSPRHKLWSHCFRLTHCGDDLHDKMKIL